MAYVLYSGGGGIFHKEPSSLKPWSVQYGIEFRSPKRISLAPVRPVLAIDLKNHEQANWSTDASARAGIQFGNFQTFGRRLQFLLEYFNGNSPTGQFYPRETGGLITRGLCRNTLSVESLVSLGNETSTDEDSENILN